MSDGVPYIRFYSDDWLSGTADLSLQERGVLITIVALIASTGKPPDANFERLSRRFGITKKATEKIVCGLVDLGKISIVDGKILNARALSELKHSQEYSKKQSERRKAPTSKKAEKDNENNEEKLPRSIRGVTNHIQNQNQEIIDKSILSQGERENDNLFDTFWSEYPCTVGQSKTVSQDAFGNLSALDQRRAVDSISAYRAFVEKKKIEPSYPLNFLRGRIFETIEPKSNQKMLVVRKGSVEWDAWDAYRASEGKPPTPEKLTVLSKMPPKENLNRFKKSNSARNGEIAA